MEPNNSKYDNGPQMKKYILGVIVIVAGFILLLTNINFFPHWINHIFFSWPMLLIGIGVVSLSTNGSRTPGTIMIVIGGVFLLQRIPGVDINVWHFFWPLILIGIGVLLLTKRLPHKPWQARKHQMNAQSLEDGYIHEENIFSGGKQRVVHQVFRGGHINCIFGGSELDLTQASLADGISELEVNTIFGGVTLIVPADWRVQLKMTSIMGGFSDKRAYIKESPDSSRVLIIKGSTIFGGGELKSY